MANPVSLHLSRPSIAFPARTLAQLAAEDILGQLIDRRGRMRELGSEGADPKLDWVDGLELLLDHAEWLGACEREAHAILARGIRHVIWAGMGGSVQTVYVLKRLGLLDHPDLSVHPCDGTDPATLNRILAEAAAAEGGPSDARSVRAALPGLLDRTMMIGVSMGMTSEEPITHLEWFDRLLAGHGLDRAARIEVMTLPGSYLDRFAAERGCARVPLQLDGGSGTGGRMSAPATRVFLRPVALRLVAEALRADPDFVPDGSRLRPVLEAAQEIYGLSRRLDAGARRLETETNPFLQLGALIAERTRAGANQVAFVPGDGWRGLEPWLEQLVEESLGKGGKGFCVFYGDQPWRALRTEPLVVGLGSGRDRDVHLDLPPADGVAARLGQLGGLCAGFKLAIAAFGYLEEIVFAGQPGVEAYKSYARAYRDAAGEVPVGNGPDLPRAGCVALDASALERGAGVDPQRLGTAIAAFGGSERDAADVLAAVLALARAEGVGGHPLRYLDFTFNGELPDALAAVLEDARARLAHAALAVPAKLRTGPSDYHSTEQSEVDGPAELVSIRIVARRHATVTAGEYSDRFLLAQARGTWQAMEDAGRWVVMLTIPELDAAACADLAALFARAAERLAPGCGN